MTRFQISLFVTGTDTEIGKTYISRLLADTLYESTAVTYMKPIHSGCLCLDSGEMRAPDFDYVMEGRAQMALDFACHVPYCFQTPCSPHLAARKARTAISMKHILECYKRIRRAHRGALIVEGAGGLMVPVNDECFMIDMIKMLEAPVVLVTSPKLGTLNHTILSLKALEQYGIALAGIVFNNSGNQAKDMIYRDNFSVVAGMVSPVPVLEVDFGGTVNSESRRFCDEIGEHLK